MTMPNQIPPRRIGPFSVTAIGLGCMNISHAYGAPPPPHLGSRVLTQAVTLGINLIDTAALYGFGSNEKLVGEVLKAHRHEIVLCSKGGMAGVAGEGGMKRVIDGRPEAIRRNCEDSLKRLGTDVIDVYYLHRWDKQVPIEDSVGEMSRLLEAGKIRAIGLSEVSAPTIRRAHAVAPIAAVQTEYSLWSRNAEIAVLDTCREIGAAFVAFSPLARGFLTDTLPDPAGFDAKDLRRSMPRFEPANWAANLRLLAEYDRITAEAVGSRAQVALAWLLHRGEHIIPIPGTTNSEHVVENFGGMGVDLTPELMARLDTLFDPKAIAGLRYSAQSLSEVDTEEFAF